MINEATTTLWNAFETTCQTWATCDVNPFMAMAVGFGLVIVAAAINSVLNPRVC